MLRGFAFCVGWVVNLWFIMFVWFLFLVCFWVELLWVVCLFVGGFVCYEWLVTCGEGFGV